MVRRFYECRNNKTGISVSHDLKTTTDCNTAILKDFQLLWLLFRILSNDFDVNTYDITPYGTNYLRGHNEFKRPQPNKLSGILLHRLFND